METKVTNEVKNEQQIQDKKRINNLINHFDQEICLAESSSINDFLDRCEKKSVEFLTLVSEKHHDFDSKYTIDFLRQENEVTRIIVYYEERKVIEYGEFEEIYLDVESRDYIIEWDERIRYLFNKSESDEITDVSFIDNL